MSYTVCIPTAGTGSRLGVATKHINKSLVEINHKPIISHIIENFHEDAEFFIPIGYKGLDVKNYLEIAHPNLNIKTIEIKPFEGPGSSLGKTLDIMQPYLNRPFIFCSCDTIVNTQNFNLDKNWIGWDNINENSSYRTIDVNEQNLVISMNEKLTSDSNKAYIGLTGIKDHELFWQIFNSKNEESKSKGEVAGMDFKEMQFEAKKFDWFDTGNPSQLSKARNQFKSNKYSVLPKENEKIWFVNDKVIKFSTNEDFIKNRVARSKILKDFVPKVNKSTSSMYVYDFVEGSVLSNIVTDEIFALLEKELEKFWSYKKLDKKELNNFYSICSEFYKDKTYERVEAYLDRYPEDDKAFKLNDIEVMPIYELLESIDWHELINGIPSNFHGDLHFENIIFNKSSSQFKFLDWRQGFGNSLEYGDIYYDLAKLLHGIIVPHPSISSGKYSITESENKKTIAIYRSENIKNVENRFQNWIIEKKYNKNKIELLCCLIFLNIAPLHHHPYSKFLFSLGHWGLQQILDKNKNINWKKINSDLNI